MSKCPEVYRKMLGEDCDDIWANEELRDKLVRLASLCDGLSPCSKTKTSDSYCENCEAHQKRRAKEQLSIFALAVFAGAVT